MNLRAMLPVFARIGFLSFGGPAAQIAILHRELVEERGWLSEEQFMGALSFCMLLPGPEAMQLATYCGWRLRGVAGGLLAGLLFVLPGAAVIFALAGAYSAFGSAPLADALFIGIKATVVVIVIAALLKVARKALARRDRWIIAGLSFVAIFAFSAPFPLIVLTAALYGAMRSTKALQPSGELAPRLGATLRIVAILAALWAAPLLAALAFGQGFLVELGLFFSKLAVVTFGGAYAVLAYMTQEVVQNQAWLTTAQMMDGLGLAETTPGPLILVTQFVGILAGQAEGGPMLAVMAGLMTLWVTFVPCFLWIFAGAPYIDWLTSRPRLAGALQAITAAVVGVILNLSIWFAAHVFFDTVGSVELGPLALIRPDLTTLNLPSVILALLAAALLLWRGLGMLSTLGIVAIVGLVLSAVV